MLTLRLIVVVGALGGSALFTPAASQIDSSPARLSTTLRKEDRTRLIELRTHGDRTAIVLFAVTPSATSRVALRLSNSGSEVLYRSDTLGYLRARVPIDLVEKVAVWSDIQALNLDGSQFYFTSARDRPSGDTVTVNATQIPPPGPATPAMNPYLPTQAIGAPQFVKAHPTFDGRGVTIAVIECCAEYLHPALQKSKTLLGAPMRKIRSIYAPADSDRYIWYVSMAETVTVTKGRFMAGGFPYSVKRDGHYRFGLTSDKYEQGFYPGTPPEHPRIGVLWDDKTDSVWVDTNADASFRDESPMLPYNTRGDAARLRWSDSVLQVAQVSSFAFTFDRNRKGIVLLMSSAHSSQVTGVAAGTEMFGGNATGVAPGATLVLFEPGLSQGGWIESYILAATLPDIDIITSEAVYDMRMHDGGSVWSVVVDRIVDVYHRPIVQSLGNDGPGLGTPNEAANGDRAIKAGGYMSRATWWSNFGLIAPRDNYVGHFASRGPRSDGGPVPLVITPLCVISTSLLRSSAALGEPNLGLFSRVPLYTLPRGYEAQCGTSYSAPMAAGALALLVSAARQSNLPYDVDRLRWSLAGGATYLPDFGAYEQGAGLLNIEAAWQRLRNAPEPVRITSRASVSTALSSYLRVPNEGAGLYEKGGWVVGERGTRQITFTRTSGPRGLLSYPITLVGNDGTFSVPPTVRLPLGVPIAVPITVHPVSTGVHSAMIRLAQSDSVTPAYETLCTIVVPEQFSAGSGYSLQRRGVAPWLSKTSYFLEVPRGAKALTVDLDVVDGPVDLVFYDPSGSAYPSTYNAVFLPQEILDGHLPWVVNGSMRRSIPNPEPGVWEVVVRHDGFNRYEERYVAQRPASFTFHANVSALRVASADKGSLAAGGARAYSTRIENALGSIEGSPKAVGVGSATRERLTLALGAPEVSRDIVVDSLATRLIVSVGAASDSSADVDLHLFDCTKGSCSRRESVVFNGHDKTISVDHPAAGRWRAVVNLFRSGAGASATVMYSDVVVLPKYGAVSVSDSAVKLTQGTNWLLPVLVRTDEPTPKSRFYQAVIDFVGVEPQTPTFAAFYAKGAAAPKPPTRFDTILFDLGR